MKDRRTSESTMLARSFSRHDQRILGFSAFLSFLITAALTILDVFRPNPNSLSPVVLNLKLPTGDDLNMLIETKEIIESRQSYYRPKEPQLICNLTSKRSDICEMNGDIRVHGNSATIFFIASSQTEILNSTDHSLNIKPYARKDSDAMASVKQVKIKTANSSEAKNIPECSRKYSIPAIVFSTGGFVGNQFHDFTDILIPLYSASVHFNGEVQFLITDKRSWFSQKHQALLRKLSKYELIDVDQENEVLCFTRIIVGLNATDKELGIDPSQSSKTMEDFRKLLRSAYSLKRESTMSKYNPTSSPNAHKNNKIHHAHGHGGRRRRLLLISRNNTRRLINAGEIAAMAESLGFDVVVNETDSRESEVAEFVNSCDVLVGVHGAGLTNMVYLPENAVVIQIIPLLGEMEWMAKRCFEDPAIGMTLKYLDYKISPNESSLIQQFPIDHEVFKDPGAITKRGWVSFKSVFLDNQDMKVDISRFKEILLKAHEFLLE